MSRAAYAFRDCPCGGGRAYGACCGRLHDGAAASTAEELMRSRFAAYALGDLDYVFRSWHPRTRPDDLTPSPGTTWTGLEVLGSVGGGPDDATGTVEFRARYRVGAAEHQLHEVSAFERRGGRWVYVDGQLLH
jgi:SEC-C motif-containing protein